MGAAQAHITAMTSCLINLIAFLSFLAFLAFLFFPPVSCDHSSFRKLEPLVMANGVVHVPVNISTRALYEDFYTIQFSVDKVLELEHAKPATFSKSMKSTLTDLTLGQLAIFNLLTDLLPLPGTDQPHKRTKRGIGSAIGEFVGGAFGLATTSDLNTVVGQINGVTDGYNHIVEVVNVEETRLAVDEHDLLLLNRSLHLVETVVGKTRKEADFIAFATHIETSQGALRDRISAAQGAVQELYSGRASNYLLPRQAAIQVLDRVATTAAKDAARSPISTPDHLYQCPASYALADDGWGWMAVIHVPTVPMKEAELQHFRFMGAVVTLPAGAHAMIGPDEPTHIALTPDEEDIYILRPDHLVTLCYRVDGTHICPQDTLLRQPTDSTCLGALFLGNTGQAKTLCGLRPLHRHGLAIPTGSGQYALFADRPTSLTIICHGSRVNDTKVVGFRTLSIDHGCYGKWRSARLHGPLSATVDQVYHSTRINTSAWAGSAMDIEPADLHKAEELLGKVVVRSAQVPHLTHLRRIEKTANYANGIAWPAVIIAVTALITLGAVFVFLGVQYMRARRAGAPPPAQP